MKGASAAGEKNQNGPVIRPIDERLPAPNFFVVGAAKAGTTSMHAYLDQHSEVFMSTLKEPHYFATFERKEQFENFLPVIRESRDYQALFDGSEKFKAVGEASPSYLCDSEAAVRIKSAIPNAKIIICLRNPVERAFSQYLMEFNEGQESLPFREALQVDEARDEKGWGVSFQYIELGLYTEQVERYLTEFGRSNVLVVLFEEFVRDTASVMQQVARFLDVDPDGYPESTFDKAHNPFEVHRGWLARAIIKSRPIRVWSKRIIPKMLRTAFRDRLLFREAPKPKMDDDIRRMLAQRFSSDLEQLELLLDRDLGLLRENG